MYGTIFCCNFVVAVFFLCRIFRYLNLQSNVTTTYTNIHIDPSIPFSQSIQIASQSKKKIRWIKCNILLISFCLFWLHLCQNHTYTELWIWKSKQPNPIKADTFRSLDCCSGWKSLHKICEQHFTSKHADAWLKQSYWPHFQVIDIIF